MEKINEKLDKTCYPLFFRFIKKIDNEDVISHKVVINIHDDRKKTRAIVVPYYKPI